MIGRNTILLSVPYEITPGTTVYLYTYTHTFSTHSTLLYPTLSYPTLPYSTILHPTLPYSLHHPNSPSAGQNCNPIAIAEGIRQLTPFPRCEINLRTFCARALPPREGGVRARHPYLFFPRGISGFVPFAYRFNPLLL